MKKREFVKALTDPVLVVNHERGKESIGICLGRDIENRGSEIMNRKKVSHNRLLRQARSINKKLFGKYWMAKIPRNTSDRKLRDGIKKGKSILKIMER